MWAERYRTLVAETQEQRKLHAEMARTRLKNGVATEVDVLRSEVAVSNGAPDLVRADNAIRQTRALLNFYLVRPLDYPTEVAGDFQEKAWDEWDLDALMREASLRRPELARLRIAERSAELQLDLAKAESRMRLDSERLLRHLLPQAGEPLQFAFCQLEIRRQLHAADFRRVQSAAA